MVADGKSMKGEPKGHSKKGFTLIELSIVLVIIGLIIGGVLVGQNLIKAAQAQSQISQITKYQTATATFYGKFGYLPGDIKDPDASNFGFVARGPYAGQGDGNGSIQGNYNNTAGTPCRLCQIAGELVMFWVDLSTAKLIDQKFSLASPSTLHGSLTASTVNTLIPAAKINGGSIYVYSDYNGTATGINYFGLSAASQTDASGNLYSVPNLTVQEAYGIDAKIDDGSPQGGNVTAQYINMVSGAANVYWPGGATGGSYTTSTAGSATSCFDNSSAPGGTPGVNGAIQHYSVEISDGRNINCALSFRLKSN